jgi:Pregnancy-associated plasma protein-A
MHKTNIVRGLAAALLISGAAWLTTNSASAAGAIEQGKRNQPAPPSLASRAERCAVDGTPVETLELIDTLTSGTKDAGGLVTVPVYWHVVTSSTGAGNVSARIPDQMNVLRDAYAGSKFAFELKGIDVTANDAWYFGAIESPEEFAMKNALRKGGPETLNIYTTNGDVYLGWATPAFYYKFGPSYDGVVLWWASLPGTGLSGATPEEPDGVLTYDQGDTGTHEVGHWLGLEHTFGPGDGTCSKPGDKIKDTPTESEPQFFCKQRDSCVGSNNPGDDPITNFMDYVDDVCMDNFTVEQTKRMRTHWHSFRDKKTRQ